MEDILDVYQRPYDPLQPLVCMDEMSKPLIDETRVPLPIMPGQPEKYDYEYERNAPFAHFQNHFGFRQVAMARSKLVST